MKPKVSYDFCYQYFTSHFNIISDKPRSDICQTFDGMVRQLLLAETEHKEKKIIRCYILVKTKCFVHSEVKSLFLQNKIKKSECIDYQQDMAMLVIPFHIFCR
jgi:hypothetical protein